MNASDLIRRLHQHRMWVNRQLLEVVRPLSEEQLKQPHPIGQGSVWRTLTHLLAAEYVWLEVLLGNESPVMPGDAPGRLPGNQAGEGAMRSLDELASRWAELAQRWNQYLDGLTDDVLDGLVYKTSASIAPGLRHGVSRADVLCHVCTHAQYTTAQLTNMLRSLRSQWRFRRECRGPWFERCGKRVPSNASICTSETVLRFSRSRQTARPGRQGCCGCSHKAKRARLGNSIIEHAD